MKKIPFKPLIILLFTILFIAGCQSGSPTITPVLSTEVMTPLPSATAEFAREAGITRIYLGEPMDDPRAELSGLTWAEEWLILLPQYPSRFEDHIYRIPKNEIVDFLKNPSERSLIPQEVSFVSAGVEKKVSGYEGFESITTIGQDAWLTIESNAKNMTGYLVHGLWNEDYSKLTLSADSLSEIPSQEHINNSSYESVLIFGKRIVTIYEANGKNVNDQPQAQLFDQSNNFIQSLNFPNIEYRVTDATQPDQNGLFWVINYFYPFDKEKLNPAEDEILVEYGQGKTHAQSETVERLVAMQFSEQGIVLADLPPIQLELSAENESRNWEGLVRLDETGFLLVTDLFPETLLVFVPKNY
ncbi:MAG: hypothetical protein CVU46_10830 [Chloroflexi bacterium HGW-Chloroflexi-8]|nr:MAG: hypothetical protein CVU46_10830 [Chloroflexi bacterium HGW-Chloroflexi-8]